jgi:hypothetical protein
MLITYRSCHAGLLSACPVTTLGQSERPDCEYEYEYDTPSASLLVRAKVPLFQKKLLLQHKILAPALGDEALPSLCFLYQCHF